MNVPKLRFKEFEGNWLETTIGEISPKIIAGGTPSTLKPEFWGGNIRWMNSGELNLKRVYKVENRISEEGLEKSSTKLIPLGCVLIGLAGQGKTRGTVAMNMVDLCTNQSIASIHPNPKVFDEDFLYHNLDNRYEELRSLSTGDGGRGGLNLQIIKSIEIYLPALEEQAKIANFLTAIDEKISQLTQKYDLLKQYKKGIMQQIFSQKLRFKNDDGREFPEWEVKKLSDINIYISDGNYGEQYPNSEQLKQFGVPFIRANNISGLSLTWADMKYIDHSLHKVLTSGHLETDDILVTTRGDIGMVKVDPSVKTIMHRV